MTIELPHLPLICLDTAKETDTHEISRGHHTVMGKFMIGCHLQYIPFDELSHSFLSADFWTTRCTNCPDALDKLQHLASLPSKVKFVSICCDSLDGAREIIERDDEVRWSSVHHYFMEFADKELCKKIFGFKQVPFYIVLNEKSEITQYGNKINWDPVYSLIGHEVQADENAKPQTNVVKTEVSTLKARTEELVENANDDFVIEDLDF